MTTPRRPDPLPMVLVVLTVTTGLGDAVSVLGLGRVFTANMTGNVVFLGFAAAGILGFSVARAVVSLGGFVVGAILGGRLGVAMADSACPIADPIHRTIVPSVCADHSAIADNSALLYLSRLKYANKLCLVSFLQWFLPSMTVDSIDDREEIAPMTCKIERHTDGQQTTLRLIGYFQAEHLEALQAQLESHGPRTVLDLDEVTLVDVEVVRFLGDCEAAGIAVLHCPPYIREWIAREQRQ